MSGFVGTLGTIGQISAALSGVFGWRVDLRDASFRGVPFYVDVAAGRGGRRLAVHEFVQRDTPSVDDLGRAANFFQLRCFVVGDDYMANRDDLLSACQDEDTSATLVHPWMGEIEVRAGKVSWQEGKELGGYCSFDIEFVEAGTDPGPFSTPDTASQLLAGIASLASVVASAYHVVSAIIANPALALPIVAAVLGDALDVLNDLPIATISGLAGAIAAIIGAPDNDVATATAVQAVCTAMAANVIASQAAPASTDDPVLGTVPAIAPSADLTGGLAALVSFGASLPAPAGAGTAQAVQAAQQAAVIALVQGSALAAVLTVYASIDWPSANAASNARTALRTMLDAQIDAAEAAGQDDLYRAWQAVGALAMADLITRAQNLPHLQDYALGASLPAAVLALRFYADPARDGELADLNDAPHLLFMPTAGLRLSQ